MEEERIGMQNTGETQSPFTDLPGALVDEVMQRSQEVGQQLLRAFEQVRTDRQSFRTRLLEDRLLCRDTELEYPPIPTCCAVDGSYTVERLLATDLAAAAAVAVEGLTPPSERRFWPEPRHEPVIEAETHSEATGTILRGLMMTMELELSSQAPHDVVFMDGSMTTPIIYLNQSLNTMAEAGKMMVAERLRRRAKAGLAAYLTILKSKRVDKCWVFCPKYTTNRELGLRLSWPSSYDDRGLLSMILDAGEFTRPTGLQGPQSPWHINISPLPETDKGEAKKLVEAIINELNNVVVIYYRPHAWGPALRLEVNQNVAGNQSRLASLLHAVKHQCGTPAILEPYPIYLADKMVKSLARAVPAFRQVATLAIATHYTGSLDEIYHGMHGYRSDSGG